MDTTNQTTPSNANFNGEQSGQENIIPTLSKEVGGELAKECGGSKNLQVVDYTPEQIRAAKDFIWDNMDETNREWITYIADIPASERAKLYIKEVYAAFEGSTKNGILVEEKMIIRPVSMRQ